MEKSNPFCPCCGREEETHRYNCPSSQKSSEDRPKKAGTDLVAEIGLQKPLFYIDKNYVLTTRLLSKLLFDGVWSESASGSITWSEYSPMMFDLFQTWMYDHQICGSYEG
ncbi:uncharacterized protein LY89DRAFT_736845 [Mollisia scopiformis]|uniref:Uncharacterized protein n=1 Tax=Mollisia scopiformis TaxID=149040 RepID=A0A194X0Y2_MOLSC|nr:uncharacterized protein LY89DRAFT_736845 [Mollisia scopiformis]KUJ13850.1 hypothetical protein LY89DRAFT_736845 [Mollisia scopiformis]